VKPLLAQIRAELSMTLRRGESVLLTLGIPVMLLVFFSVVDVLPVADETRDPVDFLAPGVLALAVMSAALVGVAIATAFERQYGVLKRIGTTPLGRPRLLAAKIAAVVAVEVLQTVLIVLAGFALGWRPPVSGLFGALAAVLLGTSAFAGIGLWMAGTQRAEMVLASANGLYLLLLLVSGMMLPLAKLPSVLRAVARVLPSSALAEILRGLLTVQGSVAGWAWPVLALWAVAAPVLAARTFRWE
jgi:ABC-2 type transport system permease protein